jgi:hypothetical protein
MNMIVIVGAVSLLVPFSIIGLLSLYRERKQGAQKMALGKAFNRLTQEHKLSVEQTDMFHKRALGLDRKNRKLVWIDHGSTQKQEICFSLLSVSSCTIAEVKDGFTAKIQKVKMIIHHRRTPTPSLLIFYDATRDRREDAAALLKKARLWKNKIDLYKHPGNIHLEQEFIL